MLERQLIGTLGFAFVAVGVTVLGFLVGSLTGAALACIVVGFVLLVISTL
jgi:hypothetical protein